MIPSYFDTNPSNPDERSRFGTSADKGRSPRLSVKLASDVACGWIHRSRHKGASAQHDVSTQRRQCSRVDVAMAIRSKHEELWGRADGCQKFDRTCRDSISDGVRRLGAGNR